MNPQMQTFMPAGMCNSAAETTPSITRHRDPRDESVNVCRNLALRGRKHSEYPNKMNVFKNIIDQQGQN